MIFMRKLAGWIEAGRNDPHILDWEPLYISVKVDLWCLVFYW